MKKVFEFLYINEKSKKYIIFTLVALFCCLTVSQSLSFFVDNANAYAYQSIKYVKLAVACVAAIYFLLDIATKKVKINFTFILLLILFTLNFIFAKSATFLFVLLFVYLLQQYKFKDFLKYTVSFLSCFLLLVVVLSFFNIIPNIEILRGDSIRYTLGFNCAPYAATMFLFIILANAYIYKKKLSYAIIIPELLICICLYIVTKARADFILSIISLATILVFKLLPEKESHKHAYSKAFSIILLLFPIILVALYGLLTLLWPTQSEFILKINLLLSNRLKFTYENFQRNGASVFGIPPTMYSTEVYTGIDNSFFNRILYTGPITAAVMLILFTFLMWDSIRKRDHYLIFALIIIAIDSFVGPIMFSFQYNLFVFAIINMFNKTTQTYDPFKLKSGFKITNSKRVSAVVVTYNRKVLLKESLEALLNQSYNNFDILVIDNASTDGTQECISDLLKNKKLHYYNTGVNLGGAGGFNYGIKKALELGSDYVWVMDDDCIAQQSALEKLLEQSKNISDDFAFLASKVLWTDGTLCNMNKPRYNLSEEISKDVNSPVKIKLASFVSIFINSKAIMNVGLPIKDFFIWGDDWEYTHRLSKKYDCYYVPDSVVVHKCAKNVGVDIASENTDRISRYLYAYRNEGYFYRKCGLYGKIYFWLKCIKHRLKIALSKDAKENKKEKVAIMKKGISASKTFNPKIEFFDDGKIRVCEFFGEPLSYGGQEAFMLNMYNNFSDEKIKYTFVTPFECDNKNLIGLAEKRADEIVAYNYKFESKSRKLYIKDAAKDLFSKQHFDVVHIQSGSVYTLLAVAKIAKKAGIKKVIIHSHCTGKKSLSYRLIKFISDMQIKKYADVFLACSDLAAEWKFPKEVIENKKYQVINNGIDVKKFTFSETVRYEYRRMLKIENNFVVCNVGRMEEQKNQLFIVEIAKILTNEIPNVKFIIVGAGSLKQAILQKIEEYNLQNNFILLEHRNDIAQIMMASDVFVLPSLFEGLGIVAIESQCTGLQTIVSPAIPNDANLTNLFMSIDLDAKLWAQTIKHVQEYNRSKYAKQIKEAGYDAKQSAAILENIYRRK